VFASRAVGAIKPQQANVSRLIVLVSEHVIFLGIFGIEVPSICLMLSEREGQCNTMSRR
jgi:hypothetical protein